MAIAIIPFESSYSPIFKELNQAWLERYFEIEPKDIVLLKNCKASIIDKGGHIFFAKYNGQMVGCFAFIKVADKTFELGKMAVDPNYQGLKIGQHLMSFGIEFAKKNNWQRIILYSSTKLETALYIYKKFGFAEVPLEKDLPYKRSDIKMELELDQTPDVSRRT